MKGFFFVWLILLPKALLSVTYAILPARVSGELPFSIDGFEIAKISALYLDYGGIKNLVAISQVEKAYAHFNLTTQSIVTKKQARELAQFLDAERLFLLSLVKKQDGYFYESKIFYPESEIVTDTIKENDPNFFFGLGKLWQKRFINLEKPFSLVLGNPPLLLIIEGSGGNYREIQELAKLIPLWGAPLSAVCAFSKDGKITQSPWNSSQEKTASFLRQIPTSGNQAGNFLSKGIHCAQEMLLKEKIKAADIWLLVSSAPESETEKIRTKGLLRQLKPKNHLVIYGSGSLSFSERDFYVSLAQELSSQSKSQYQDILYQKKVGLATGESYYIFKKGFSIIESKDQDPKEGVEVALPAHERMFFHPERLVEQYRKMSKHQILSEERLELVFLLPKKENKDIPELKDYFRFLIQFPEGSFWFSFPAQSVKKWPKENETITFATILIPPEYGLPIENHPTYVKIFENYRDVPKLLLLDIKEYLKSPNKFLGQSIGGSSLYILTGKVLEIRKGYADRLE